MKSSSFVRSKREVAPLNINFLNQLFERLIYKFVMCLKFRHTKTLSFWSQDVRSVVRFQTIEFFTVFPKCFHFFVKTATKKTKKLVYHFTITTNSLAVKSLFVSTVTFLQERNYNYYNYRVI